MGHFAKTNRCTALIGAIDNKCTNFVQKAGYDNLDLFCLQIVARVNVTLSYGLDFALASSCSAHMFYFFFTLLSEWFVTWYICARTYTFACFLCSFLHILCHLHNFVFVNERNATDVFLVLALKRK